MRDIGTKFRRNKPSSDQYLTDRSFSNLMLSGEAERRRTGGGLAMVTTQIKCPVEVIE
jgi:hypothetical protein